MNNTFSFRLIISVIIFALFCSCSESSQNSSFEKLTSKKISRSESESASEDESSIDDAQYEQACVLGFKFARDYAFAEFCSNIELYFPDEILDDLNFPNFRDDVGSLSVTSLPIQTAYDCEGYPLFYEFPIIYQNDFHIATMVVNAQPYDEELIDYLFPIASGMEGGYRTKLKGYYNSNDYITFSNLLFKNEQNVVLRTCEEESNISQKMMGASLKRRDVCASRSDMLDNLVSAYPEEERMAIEIDMQSDYSDNEGVYETLKDYINSYNHFYEMNKYWGKLVSDAGYRDEAFEIDDVMLQWIENNNAIGNVANVNFLEEYKDNHLRLTRWRGWCGPTVLAWLYRGKYDSYAGQFIHIFGTSGTFDDFHQTKECAYYDAWKDYCDADNGLFNAYYEETQTLWAYIFGTHPLFHSGLVRGVENTTNNEYTVKYTSFPITRMEELQQPLVVETTDYGEPHYLAAIGYAYNRGFLGIKKNRHLFVADNGSATSHNRYYPFWRKVGGLHYYWEPK